MPDRRSRNLAIAAVLATAAVIVGAVTGAVILTSGEQPPATGAAALVPGDALVYAHLSTDRSRPAVQRALALARRLPNYALLRAALERRVGSLLGGSANDVAAWLGREAAVALLNTSASSAGLLVVLDVARPQLARGFVAAGGATPDGSDGRVTLLRYPSGLEAAFVSHYLVAGPPGSVRSAIAVSAGRLPSLQQNASYRRASGSEPDGRVLDAYVPVAGVRRVLGSRGGVLGALSVLLDQPALTGTALSVSAEPGGLKLDADSALDPTLARISSPSAAPFSPSLSDVLPRGSVLMLDVSNLEPWAPRVLKAVASAGLAGRIGPLLGQLGGALASEGVDVHRLTAVFGGETALAISPSGAAPPAGSRGLRGSALLIVTRTNDQAATAALLASLEVPLAQLFPPPASGAGQVPEFTEVPVDGVTVHRLALAPGLELDYAVFRGLVVVATSLPAISSVVARSEALSHEPLYRAAIRDEPDQVTSLLFLDFRALLRLGERTGLVHGGRLAALLPDLEMVSSVGLTTTRQESDTNAELFLHIP